MKKALSLLLIFALVACIFSPTSLYSAFAYEEKSYSNEPIGYYNEEDYKILEDGSYIIPVAKNIRDYYNKRQLTSDELISDTKILLDLVLNSGYINPGYSSSPGYPGYSGVRANFNGLQELEKRIDAGTVMLYRYLKESLKFTCGYYGNSISISQLYALLVQDVFVNKLTAKEARVFQIADDCYRNQIKWRIVTSS